METRRSKVLAIAALAVAGVMVPSAAYGISIYSNDGSGTQAVTTRYNNGAAVNGRLASKSTDRYVYYRGLVDWSSTLCSDSAIGRYTPNTNSLRGVTRGGTVTAFPGPGCRSGGVKASVCRDISYRPDPCGAWSGRF